MKDRELTQLELDYAFIAATGEPFRDEEMLSWDGLRFDRETKEIVKIET